MRKSVIGAAVACVVFAAAGFVAGLLVERLILAKPASSDDQAVAARNGASKAKPDAPNSPLPESMPAIRLQEQAATLVNIRAGGTFEVFYQQPFDSTPALDIFDDTPNLRWTFAVKEQQSDGFKLHVTGAPDNTEKRLRYVAKGLALTAEPIAVQRGDIDPSDKINDLEFDVFYPRPYAQAPSLKLTEPGPIGWETRIKEQWPHGFRVKLSSYSKTDEKCARYEARGLLLKSGK